MNKKYFDKIFDLLMVVLIVGGFYIGIVHNLASGICLIASAYILIHNQEHRLLEKRIEKLKSKQNRFL